MSDIVRRDPRKDWIARNRLHPQHLEVLAELGQGAASEWVGPAGIVRRNPHAVGFMGPNGLKRIDRSGVQQGAGGGGAAKTTAQSKPLVEIESPAFLVAVVPDMAGGRLSGHDRDLLGLARQLADADPDARGAVLAVVYGEHKEDGFGEAGVDRLLTLDDPRFDGFAPEARLGALLAVEEAWTPRHWLVPDSKLGGADLGRRLAARLGERPATGVWQLEPDADAELGWQCTARGAAATIDIQRPLPRITLALEECAEPVDDNRHAAEALSLPQELPSPISRIEDLGQVPVDPSGVALAEAEFILSAGNGIRDWDGFHTAAEVLGATEGASRVAVDDGFMARDRQVGATGTWVTARVYVAVGISGAIQHLQGIQTCDKVVAINMDPGCDMIKRADLAVIGDSAEVLGSLVAMVKQQREEKRDAA
ncbi:MULTISPECIES: electron transfer flavoprotein subunit alpha [Halomonas]|uniref:Electron transfer flavoprotein subunit alpha n=1 Tax=Halomonas halophila TaxID=29573 RepID=A0ABQ0U2N4_9GAMM|nr:MULTISPECIES: electron transfer flavoprotein subunit alpha/FixB family protein [Halomonas]MDR5890131.1 electron transfer flavoprotein subunit alpha/FixB family protein [Halomonas salina]RAH37916.1 electron transfer flavoprotein subunit alpha/FixB family protein [Halomonas sp. SL1]WJY06609.1 electron transfer flavoprotein subunit alpha/FixB family protein [Halomonas halophila]GEK72796.1 electron transfer flavoprotein subunit alpha [Halomonas halophila]